MSQLNDFSADELEELERQYQRTAKTGLDKHKRWEAEQKLKLVRAELKRRANPMKGIKRQLKKWFGN